MSNSPAKGTALITEASSRMLKNSLFPLALAAASSIVRVTHTTEEARDAR